MALQPRGHMVVTNDATGYRFELIITPNGEFTFRLMYREVFIFALFHLPCENVTFATYDRIVYTLLYMLCHSYEFVAGKIIVVLPLHISLICVCFFSFRNKQQLFFCAGFSSWDSTARVSAWVAWNCTTSDTYTANVSPQRKNC